MKQRSLVFHLFCVIISVVEAAREDRATISESKYRDGIKNAFESDESHEFRNFVVDKKSDTIYVGGVNYIYALDANDIGTIKRQLHIPPQPLQVQRCTYFRNAVICQNNIRVLHSLNRTTLYACGTMAYSPTCTYINKEDLTEIPPRIKGGEWENAHDTFTVSTMMDGVLFAATSDLSPTNDDTISKSMNGVPLKTQNKDPFWLSEAHFVSAFNARKGDGQDKLYILFRENAEEIPMEFLTQEQDSLSRLVYSRVATICKNDKGGNTWVLNNKFSTFTKMRIACPSKTITDGKRSGYFYYDEIRDTYIVPNPKDASNPTLYAIFTTPGGSVEATATCIYNLHDIEDALNSNKYWNRPGTGGSWYSTYNSSYGPPPGTCVEDTTTLSNERLAFGKAHPIKYGIIKPVEGHAIYQDSGTVFSYIIVDRLMRIEAIGKENINREYDIVHYITESGFVKRVVYSIESREMHWVIPSRRVFNDSQSNVILSVKKSDGFLYFGTNTSVIQLSIAACAEYETCTECTSAHDPYCMWDGKQKKCIVFTPDIPLIEYYNTGSNDTKCEQEEKLTDLRKFERNMTNQTIVTLMENNSALATELAKCKHEQASLKKNYTALSTLILRYDTTRKLAIQLYKNTIYSLHKCQHKETLMIQRLRDEESARRKVVVEKNALSKNASVTMCESEAPDRESSSKSVIRTKTAGGINAVKKCERQRDLLNIKHSRITKDLESKILNLEKETSKNNKSLSSCLSNSASLESQNEILNRVKNNVTRQNRLLQQQYLNSKRTVERIKWLRRRVAGCKSSSRCGLKAGWFFNENTQTVFFLTEESAYDVGKGKCRHNGASLAMIKNANQIKHLKNILEVLEPHSQFWVGLRKHRNGRLEWDDGTLYDATGASKFLTENEEEIGDQEAYCLRVDSELKWELVNCNSVQVSLCEKSFAQSIIDGNDQT